MDKIVLKSIYTTIEMLKDRNYVIDRHTDGHYAKYSDSFYYIKGTFPREGANGCFLVCFVSDITSIDLHMIYTDDTIAKNKIFTGDIPKSGRFIRPSVIKGDVNEFSSFGINNDIFKLIVVYYDNTISNPLKKRSNVEINIGYYKQSDIEFFDMKKMIVNPMRHELQPVHKLFRHTIDVAEIEEIMKTYNASKINFPKKCIDDVVTKYYNAKEGDMFKIINYGSIYYCIVSSKTTNCYET